MSTSTRWQDWANVGLGVWLFASPWALGYGGAAASNAWAFGLFAIVVALWGLFEPDSRTPEASNLALGTWVFFVPWLLGFAGATSIAAWNAWTVGGAIAGLAVWSLERIAHVAHRHA